MNNLEAQNEEILVLQSIYDSKYFIVDRLDPPCGRYLAEVHVVDDFYVLKYNHSFSHNEPSPNCSQSGYEKFQVEFLPAINLYFEYPDSYPSDSPPAFFLSCSWLSHDQLSKLCKQLDNLWVEGNGEVILFQWIQFLKEEALTFLSIDKRLDITEISKYNFKTNAINNVPLDGESFENMGRISGSNAEQTKQKSLVNLSVCSIPIIKPAISGGNGMRDCRAFLDIANGKILKNLLIDYNKLKKTEIFSDSFHICNICFTNKQGSEFITFNICHHFFCKDCIKSYFELMITEGNVHSLICPQDKCSTQADDFLVKQVVSCDSFERYDSLLLMRTLQTMSDISYCPRSACQCPLLTDVCGKMGICPACKFVFCPLCKMAFHGIAPCNFRITMTEQMRKEICDDYLQGDDTKKAELEDQYGKKAMKSLVENVLSETWIGSNSKNCPHCNASIEKTGGCNKITCFRCGTFFCWLCVRHLKASNPYFHFSDPKSKCYNKLFPPEHENEDFMY